MPKRIESLVLWLIPALVLQFVAYLFADGYVPEMSAGIESVEDIPVLEMLFRATIAPMFIYVPNVVTAIWMWRTESALGGRKVRWTLASLLLSYFVLIPYLGMFILWRLEQKGSEQLRRDV